MKKPNSILNLFIFITSMIICTSCSQEIPDPIMAQTFIEGYMQKIDDGDFTNLSEYFSEEMQNGENDVDRIAKFKQLSKALGKTISITLIQQKSVNEPDSPPSINFIYEVKHSNQVVIEMYTVIKETNKFKISKQNIVSKSAWVPN